MRKLTQNQQQILTSMKNAKVNGVMINDKTTLMRVVDVKKAVENKYGRGTTTSAVRHTLSTLESRGKIRVAKLKVGDHTTLNLYAAK